MADGEVVFGVDASQWPRATRTIEAEAGKLNAIFRDLQSAGNNIGVNARNPLRGLFNQLEQVRSLIPRYYQEINRAIAGTGPGNKLDLNRLSDEFKGLNLKHVVEQQLKGIEDAFANFARRAGKLGLPKNLVQELVQEMGPLFHSATAQLESLAVQSIAQAAGTGAKRVKLGNVLTQSRTQPVAVGGPNTRVPYRTSAAYDDAVARSADAFMRSGTRPPVAFSGLTETKAAVADVRRNVEAMGRAPSPFARAAIDAKELANVSRMIRQTIYPAAAGPKGGTPRWFNEFTRNVERQTQQSFQLPPRAFDFERFSRRAVTLQGESAQAEVRRRVEARQTENAAANQRYLDQLQANLGRTQASAAGFAPARAVERGVANVRREIESIIRGPGLESVFGDRVVRNARELAGAARAVRQLGAILPGQGPINLGALGRQLTPRYPFQSQLAPIGPRLETRRVADEALGRELLADLLRREATAATAAAQRAIKPQLAGYPTPIGAGPRRFGVADDPAAARAAQLAVREAQTRAREEAEARLAPFSAILRRTAAPEKVTEDDRRKLADAEEKVRAADGRLATATNRLADARAAGQGTAQRKAIDNAERRLAELTDRRNVTERKLVDAQAKAAKAAEAPAGARNDKAREVANRQLTEAEERAATAARRLAEHYEKLDTLRGEAPRSPEITAATRAQRDAQVQLDRARDQVQPLATKVQDAEAFNREMRDATVALRDIGQGGSATRALAEATRRRIGSLNAETFFSDQFLHGKAPKPFESPVLQNLSAFYGGRGGGPGGPGDDGPRGPGGGPARGPGEAFLGGLTQRGFTSRGGFRPDLTGIAGTAGTLVKYGLLSAAVYGVAGAFGTAKGEVVDYIDSLTDLTTALDTGIQDFGALRGSIDNNVVPSLERLSRLSGANVGESLDAMTRGVRAFTDSTAPQNDRIRVGVKSAEVANQLAVITGGSVKDKTGDLIAIGTAFGYTGDQIDQVTDAIAHARSMGGDLNQISQGLANFAAVAANAGVNAQEAANLISVVQARTDQSGQAVATRLGRITQIIGTAGNQDVLKRYGVDTAAGFLEQLAQLNTGLKDVSPQERKAVVSRLAGTANVREFSVAMENADKIIKKSADDLAHAGAGAELFRRKTGDLAGLFRKIHGDIRNIIINLQRSDVGALLGASLVVFERILSVVAGITGWMARMPGLLTTAAFGGLQLLAILKAVAFVRGRAADSGLAFAAERAPLSPIEQSGAYVVGGPGARAGARKGGTAVAPAIAEQQRAVRAASAEMLELNAAQKSLVQGQLIMAQGAVAAAEAEIRRGRAMKATTASAGERLAADKLIAASETQRQAALAAIATHEERLAVLQSERAKITQGEAVVTERLNAANAPLIASLEAEAAAEAKVAGEAKLAAAALQLQGLAAERAARLNVAAASTAAGTTTAAAARFPGLAAAQAALAGGAIAGGGGSAAAGVGRGGRFTVLPPPSFGGVPPVTQPMADAASKGMWARFAAMSTLAKVGWIGLGTYIGYELIKGAQDAVRSSGEARQSAVSAYGALGAATTVQDSEKAIAALREAGQRYKRSAGGFFGSINDFFVGIKGPKLGQQGQDLLDAANREQKRLDDYRRLQQRYASEGNAKVFKDFTVEGLQQSFDDLNKAGASAGEQMRLLAEALGDFNRNVPDNQLLPKKLAEFSKNVLATANDPTGEIARGALAATYGTAGLPDPGDRGRFQSTIDAFTFRDAFGTGFRVPATEQQAKHARSQLDPDKVRKEREKRKDDQVALQDYEQQIAQYQDTLAGYQLGQAFKDPKKVQELQDKKRVFLDEYLKSHGITEAGGGQLTEDQQREIASTMAQYDADAAGLDEDSRRAYAQGLSAKYLESIKAQLGGRVKLGDQAASNFVQQRALELANTHAQNLAFGDADALRQARAQIYDIGKLGPSARQAGAPGTETAQERDNAINLARQYDAATKAAGEALKPLDPVAAARRRLAEILRAEENAVRDGTAVNTSLVQGELEARRALADAIEDDAEAGIALAGVSGDPLVQAQTRMKIANQRLKYLKKLRAGDFSGLGADVNPDQILGAANPEFAGQSTAEDLIKGWHSVDYFGEGETAGKQIISGIRTGLGGGEPEAPPTPTPTTAADDRAQAQGEKDAAALRAKRNAAKKTLTPQQQAAADAEIKRQEAEKKQSALEEAAAALAIRQAKILAGADPRSSASQLSAQIAATRVVARNAPSTEGRISANTQVAQLVEQQWQLQLQTATTAAQAARFPGDQLGAARDSIKNAQARLAHYVQGTLEWNQALIDLHTAQVDLASAVRDASRVDFLLGHDITDPVVQARAETRTAKQKLRDDRRAGADRGTLHQDRLDVQTAQANEEAARFHKRFDAARTADQLGRISHAQYIRYLQNEHDRLTAIKKRSYQQQQFLNEVDAALQAAQQSLQGQFNIGDIKLPTPYEVRRFIAAQTDASTAGAYGQGTTQTVNITINGASQAQIDSTMSKYFGPLATQSVTTAPRK